MSRKNRRVPWWIGVVVLMGAALLGLYLTGWVGPEPQKGEKGTAPQATAKDESVVEVSVVPRKVRDDLNPGACDEGHRREPAEDPRPASTEPPEEPPVDADAPPLPPRDSSQAGEYPLHPVQIFRTFQWHPLLWGQSEPVLFVEDQVHVDVTPIPYDGSGSLRWEIVDDRIYVNDRWIGTLVIRDRWLSLAEAVEERGSAIELVICVECSVDADFFRALAGLKGGRIFLTLQDSWLPDSPAGSPEDREFVLSRLWALAVNGGEMDPRALKPWLDAQNLRWLAVRKPTLREEVVELVSGVTRLRTLMLDAQYLPESAYRQLGRLTQLRMFMVGGLVRYGPELFEAWSGLTQLKSFMVAGLPDPEGLTAWLKVVPLESFAVLSEVWPLSTEVLSAIAESKKIRVLHLRTNVTPDGFIALGRLTSLQSLLVGCASLEDRHYRVLGRWPNLENLYLLSPGKLTARGLGYFPRMPNLKNLFIVGANFGDDAGVALPTLPGLESLKLQAGQLTGRTLTNLFRSPSLTAVDLSNSGLNDAGMAVLTQSASLKTLDISFTAVTKDGMALLAGQTGLTRLNLSRSEFDTAPFPFLKKLTRLERLMLPDCPLTSETVEALGALKNLLVLDLSDRFPLVSSMEPLVGARKIIWFSLARTPYRGGGLDSLAMLPELRRVSLAKTSTTDLLLPAFARFPALERLDLGQTMITDAGLGTLAGCDRLRVLRLAGVPLTGAQFPNSLRRLEAVDISQTRFGAEGVASLVASPALRELRLSSSDIDDESLAGLEGARGLKRLELNAVPVNGTGLTALASSDSLHFLELAGSRFSNAAAQALPVLKGLWRLTLSGTKITDEGVSSLAKLTELRELFLSECELTGAGFEALRPLTHLRQLKLECVPIYSEFLIHIAALESLESIEITGTCENPEMRPKITDADLAVLAKMPNLRRLRLSGTDITGSGFGVEDGFRSLRILHLDRCPVTDDSVRAVLAMEGVLELELGMTSITDATLNLLGRGTKLRTLGVIETGVTEERVGEVRKHLNSLELRWMKIPDHPRQTN